MFVLIAVQVLTIAPVCASGRIALLIGNQGYADKRFLLKNSVNDVLSLNAALLKLGFSVEVLRDATSSQMAIAVEDFGEQAREAEFAVFFYAGHGVQIGGNNLLLGTDLAESTTEGAARASIALGMVRDRLDQAKPGVGIIMLDACRTTPLGETVADAREGLAQANGGAGLLIAYATDPGNVAMDGAGSNSVFTSALLDHLETPGLDVRLMFGRVRQQVVLKTGGMQVPWVEEALIGEHSFSGDVANTLASTPEAKDVESWRLVSAAGTEAAYRGYLAEFPNGLFRDLAGMRLGRQGGTAHQSADADAAEQILLEAGPQRVAAALDLLGYQPQTRSIGGGDYELRPALLSYLGATARSSGFRWDGLLREASRELVLLGATLARRVRADMAALASAQRALKIAEASYDELSRLVQANPEAQPVLQEAAQDLGDIRASVGAILERLDQSRGYYAELLASARTHFGSAVRDPAVFSQERGSEAIKTVAQIVARDARLFQRHVEISLQQRGTYRWLSDFLPR